MKETIKKIGSFKQSKNKEKAWIDMPINTPVIGKILSSLKHDMISINGSDVPSIYNLMSMVITINRIFNKRGFPGPLWIYTDTIYEKLIIYKRACGEIKVNKKKKIIISSKRMHYIPKQEIEFTVISKFLNDKAGVFREAEKTVRKQRK